jgi:hypothetical protein
MTTIRVRSSQLALFAVLAISALDIDAKSASALFVLAAIIFLGALRKSWRPIPSVSLVVVGFIAGYALPVWFFTQTFERLPVAAVNGMMQWALRSFLVFALAYNSVARNKPAQGAIAVGWMCREKSLASFTLLSLGLISIAAWLTSVAWLGLGFVFIEGTGSNSGGGTPEQILFLFSEMKYPYFLGYLLLRQQHGVGKAHRLVFFMLGGVALVEIVAIGSKGAIIRLAAIFVLALLFERAGGLGWKKIIGGLFAAAICLFSFQVITEYRQIMRDASVSGQDIGGFAVRYEAFVESMASSMRPDERPRQTKVDSDAVGERLGSGAFGLAWTIELTGGQSPYENAFHSVLAPLYAILPRVIYPDKPIFFNSGRFASEYFGWEYGGISISLLGSLYFAWGYWGMLAAMAVVGAALAALANRIERYGAVAMGSIVYFTVVTLHLLDVGMEFQPLLINMTRVFLLLAVVRLAWGFSIRNRTWRG